MRPFIVVLIMFLCWLLTNPIGTNSMMAVGKNETTTSIVSLYPEIRIELDDSMALFSEDYTDWKIIL